MRSITKKTALLKYLIESAPKVAASASRTGRRM
jgi:hypothetical protein